MGETADYNKSATPTAHATTHQLAGSDVINVAGLSGVLADAQPSTWALVSGKPSTFPPDAHTHVKADITNTPWAWTDVSKVGSKLSDLAARPIDQLEALAANKTFNNAAFSISFNFTNPSGQPTYDGAFEIQASGAFTGDLLHVHQHTGNPGPGSHLVHLETEDADVLPLRIASAAAICMTINKQIESTLPIGTSPFAVTSTTLNTNLNADLLDGVHASSLEPTITAGLNTQYWRGDKTWQTLNQAAVSGLAITDSPAFTTVKLSALTDGYLPYHVSDAAGLANAPFYTDGTNVIIGDIIGTPDRLLQVVGSGGGALLEIADNIGGSRHEMSYAISATQGELDCYHLGTGPLNLVLNPNGGKVGIAMTPVYTLDVVGNLRSSTGFGCNGTTPQTAYASGGALAAYAAGANGLDTGPHMASLHALVVAIRAALVANGIMS